jgi:hypothetical protein
VAPPPSKGWRSRRYRRSVRLHTCLRVVGRVHEVARLHVGVNDARPPAEAAVDGGRARRARSVEKLRAGRLRYNFYNGKPAINPVAASKERFISKSVVLDACRKRWMGGGVGRRKPTTAA